MPYTGTSDPDLPDNVKKLPADKKAQWVAVWNSAYKSCIDDGGTASKCESSAFAQAWGVVNKENSIMQRSKFEQFIEKIKNQFAEFLGIEIQQRAISIGDMYSALDEKVWEKDDWGWLTNIYAEDDGNLFGIVASGGKLFKFPIVVTNGIVDMGEWAEVKIDFPEVRHRSNMVLRQTEDGRYRFVSISAASVLNRMGEIDSKKLFDSFIEHAETTNEYPVRQFFHCGAQFRTGQVDFMARDENLLIMSGLYDDSQLAQLEIKARLADPEYWGDSIGFYALEAPEMFEISDGVKIPVYTRGICTEVSTLPESMAASWLTAMPKLDKEVNRMIGDTQMQVLVEKIFGGDEDAAKKWLLENVDEKNRAIIEAGMITRASTETTEPAAESLPETQPEPVERVEEETPKPESPKEEVATTEVEMDENMLEALKVALGIEDMQSKLSALEEAIGKVTQSLERMSESAVSLSEDLKKRIALLEGDEQKRRDIIAGDMPRGNRIKVTYRPRANGDIVADVGVAPVTMQDMAEEFSSRVPNDY